MSRRNIFEKIPKKPDFDREIQKIYGLMLQPHFGMYTIEKDLNQCFLQWPHRATAMNFQELMISLDIPISNRGMKAATEDQFLDFLEIIVNLISFRDKTPAPSMLYVDLSEEYKQLLCQIDACLSSLNYRYSTLSDGRVILIPVEVEVELQVLTEDFPDISDLILEYRGRKLSGDVEKKRHILGAIGRYIEPLLEDKTLKNELMPSVVSDVGFALNNFNIRHNNAEGKHRKEFLEKISPEDYEKLLDDTFTGLLTLLHGKNMVNVHQNIKSLKQKIV
jgi:hypothetical protein